MIDENCDDIYEIDSAGNNINCDSYNNIEDHSNVSTLIAMLIDLKITKIYLMVILVVTDLYVAYNRVVRCVRFGYLRAITYSRKSILEIHTQYYFIALIYNVNIFMLVTKQYLENRYFQNSRKSFF